MTAEDVVALLAAAVRTEVEVREPADGGRTVLRGTGTVDVTLDDDGALVVRERGSWRREGAPGTTPYTDALRFRGGPGGARLEVEHLRRGEPVPLVALAVGADGQMRAEAPHVCGADEYTAELEAAAGVVVLRWRVRGRVKDQEVVRTYRDRADQPASNVRSPAARSFSESSRTDRQIPS